MLSCTSWRETVRQRALVVITLTCPREPDPAPAGRSLQHLRFRKHDVAVFHLLDPQELGFSFRRPMRFLDMEGGPAIFAEPNEIADRAQKGAGRIYLEGLHEVVLESAVDYHRVTIGDEDMSRSPCRFVGRTRQGVR